MVLFRRTSLGLAPLSDTRVDLGAPPCQYFIRAARGVVVLWVVIAKEGEPGGVSCVRTNNTGT